MQFTLTVKAAARFRTAGMPYPRGDASRSRAAASPSDAITSGSSASEFGPANLRCCCSKRLALVYQTMAQKATASDDSPIPGYMYGEFAKQTLASYEACRQLEEYLLKRIVNKNPNVKLKSLLDAGVLTQEEFDNKKAEILKRF